MRRLLFLILPAVLAAGGCAQPYEAGVFHSGLRAQQVEIGRVVAVARVRVTSGRKNGGAVLGLLGGAAAGHAIGGSGTTGLLATLGGAVVGGWAGSRLEQAAGAGFAYQVTVRLRVGTLIAVVEQGRRAARLHDGQCVQVISQGSRTRVMPLPSSNCGD